MAALPARGVILLQSEERNTTPPTGSLLHSGWQYQGSFGAFLGTPISSRFFITAQHIGSIPAGLGQPFFYGGSVYHTDQAVDVPGTDLRLWRIAETFGSWAPMYDRLTDGPETGKGIVVYGRGTQRGEPIYLTTPASAPSNGTSVPVRLELKGWQWGPSDGVQSWGQNKIDELITDADLGELLYFGFDNPGGPNEGIGSAGDSGGGVFIQSPTGQWKLAGINFAIDGPFRLKLTDPEFFGALFDAGGLYAYTPPTFIPEQRADIPAGTYASAISGSLPFINYTINSLSVAASVPEPTTGFYTVAGILALRRRRA